MLYRVDIGVGPLNWSDAGIDSGAPLNGPDARSSFHFQRNVLVVDSGSMFAGSTSNGYRNMSFSDNVYWDLSSSNRNAVEFPCNPNDPSAGHDYITGCLKATVDTQISSPSGRVKAGFNHAGSQFCVTEGTTKLWCADYPASIAGLDFNTNEACMQSDVSAVWSMPVGLDSNGFEWTSKRL